MKAKKKINSLIKVRFIKAFAGHSVGNVIATDMATVNFLVNNKYCEAFVETKIETEKVDTNKKVPVEKPKQPIKEIKVKAKPTGRPKKK